MRKILVYLVVFFSGLISAQEAQILFNRMNMAVYNPAFTGTNGAFVSLNSRSQWSGIQDAPRTNYLIYHMPQREKVRIGLTAQNDRVFIENKTHFTIDYNYELQLSDEQFIYLGLKGGGFYNNIDVERLERLYSTFNPAKSQKALIAFLSDPNQGDHLEMSTDEMAMMFLRFLEKD